MWVAKNYCPELSVETTLIEIKKLSRLKIIKMHSCIKGCEIGNISCDSFHCESYGGHKVVVKVLTLDSKKPKPSK